MKTSKTSKTRRAPALRPLDDASLGAVTGGIIIFGSTDRDAAGMIIHGSEPSLDAGAVIFWRSVPSGI